MGDLTGTLTLHVKDQNGIYLTGRTITARVVGGGTDYAFTEVTGSPGVYKYVGLLMGYLYNFYNNGVLLGAEYQNYPFGYSVANDTNFLAEHNPTGGHTDIVVDSITWR